MVRETLLGEQSDITGLMYSYTWRWLIWYVQPHSDETIALIFHLHPYFGIFQVIFIQYIHLLTFFSGSWWFWLQRSNNVYWNEWRCQCKNLYKALVPSRGRFPNILVICLSYCMVKYTLEEFCLKEIVDFFRLIDFWAAIFIFHVTAHEQPIWFIWVVVWPI